MIHPCALINRIMRHPRQAKHGEPKRETCSVQIDKVTRTADLRPAGMGSMPVLIY